MSSAGGDWSAAEEAEGVATVFFSTRDGVLKWRWRLKQPPSLDDGGWSKMEKAEEKVWEGEKGERKCV